MSAAIYNQDRDVQTIATAERNWRGTNRTGWSNAAFDRVYDAYSRALERDERNRHMAEMARLLNDELPVMPMYFNYEVVAHTAALTGPTIAAPTSTVHDSIFSWDWR